ncbi:hypothetical protein JST97_38290 [bacterium]|nr:hypothetical protein [bacterium]
MASLAPIFFLALSLFFHVGIILPLLSGWLYSHTSVAPTPPPISVRMAAPSPPVAPARPVGKSRGVAGKARTVHPRPLATAPAFRPPVFSAPGSAHQVAASPEVGSRGYPTYPQGHSRGAGPVQAGDRIDRPLGGESPAVPSVHQPILETARVTGLPRTILVPSFLQKQEARNFVVTFEVTVEADGSPRVRVFRGSGCTGLDQMLTDELGQMGWQPASRDGQPVASTFHISVSGDFRKGCENFTLSQTPVEQGSASQN